MPRNYNAAVRVILMGDRQSAAAVVVQLRRQRF